MLFPFYKRLDELNEAKKRAAALGVDIPASSVFDGLPDFEAYDTGVTETQDLLGERQKTHGRFGHTAYLAQELKNLMRGQPGYRKLEPAKKESLEMIVLKISRIVNGDSNHVDSWRDIAGYAELIVQQLEKRELPHGRV